MRILRIKYHEDRELNGAHSVVRGLWKEWHWEWSLEEECMVIAGESR